MEEEIEVFLPPSAIAPASGKLPLAPVDRNLNRGISFLLGRRKASKNRVGATEKGGGLNQHIIRNPCLKLYYLICFLPRIVHSKIDWKHNNNAAMQKIVRGKRSNVSTRQPTHKFLICGGKIKAPVDWKKNNNAAKPKNSSR